MSYVSVVYASSKRQSTLLVITEVSLQTSVAGNKNVHRDLEIVFKTFPFVCTAWGCTGHRLTKGHQFRRAVAVLQSFVWSSVSSTIIWKSCPCEGRPATLDLLHFMKNNVQSRYALVVACFVGRSLGPALDRAVVLGGLGLAQNIWTSNEPIDLKIVILTCELLWLID